MKREPIGWLRRSRAFPLLLLLASWLVARPCFSQSVFGEENLTGPGIMQEAFDRHELPPYVFEAQTLILMDAADNRDLRTARRFSRVEKDGTIKYLLVLDNPVEIRGVAVLAVRSSTGIKQSHIYLPALGGVLKSTPTDDHGSHFFGADFNLGDLGAEVLSDFRYTRKTDRNLDKIMHFVVEALPKGQNAERETGYGLRRHFVRKDNFFIGRTDYFDRRGRFLKRRTQHDLKRLDERMWRANMVLMENYKKGHSTLIKIDRRVFSRDYVPPEMFTFEWLLNNRHIEKTRMPIFQRASAKTEKQDNRFPDVFRE